jgi:aryl-alcohol dehydrogenase-like predicted oxidoreductase
MRTISLGGLKVSRIGLGAMGMSAYYTGAGRLDDESIRTIHRALDLGVTHLDTAEAYGRRYDADNMATIDTTV